MSRYYDLARERLLTLQKRGKAIVLSIETSCDETAAAVVQNGRQVLSNAVYTQIPIHRKFGGVVPELASRNHVDQVGPVVESALADAGLTLADVDAIAVTGGPGLVGALLVGVSYAKGLAFASNKPAAAVSTLAAMARNVAFADGLVICAMDARRSQIYNALFEAKDGQLTRLTEDRAVGLADLAEEIRNDPRPKTVVGDGAKLCYTFLTEAGISCRMAPPHLVMQNAMSVALEAEQLAAEEKLVSAQALEPVYLRPAQADPLRKK